MAHAFRHADLHMHSVFSDGTDTPGELRDKVKAAGIDFFSLTDHDGIDGCDAMEKLLCPGDPAFLCGVELSCRDELGKYHILGYGYNKAKPSIATILPQVHNARIQKVKNRIAYLSDTFGFFFTAEEVDALLQNENPGKPHIAALMIKKGYVRDTAEGFEKMAGYRGNEFTLSPQVAIESILDADGIAVLAHGILADGSKRLSEEEITARVDRLKKFGLIGIEGYYSGFDDEEERIMLDLAEKNHLLVTAGSDYHGKNKTVTLGDTRHPDPARMERFFATAELLLG